MLNMLVVDICAYGFTGLGTGICALLTEILYGLLQLVCKLVGTFVDLLNIAFYIFAGVDYGDGRFYIKDAGTGAKKSILDFFIFDETVTKSYLYLSIIALVLVAIFTIYKIIKQDYFDKAGPRSKGPIFRNVAISCISFLLVIPIFYLIIHASSLLAVEVLSAMGVDMDTYAGMKVFELSWSDGGQALHIVNNQLGGVSTNAGTMWYLEKDVLFTLMADGELVKYDPDIVQKINLDGNYWKGPLATYSNTVTLPTGEQVSNYLFYAQFYWYIYFVAIIVALKAMWTLVLAMIQRIFKLLGLFIVAPAPISQYVLDDGAKFKKWLEQSIQEGLRLVTASFSFAIFLMVLGLISRIDFYEAFSTSMTAVSGGRAETAVNVTASTLAYQGEFANIPTHTETNLVYMYEGYIENGITFDLVVENFTYKYVELADTAWTAIKATGCTIAVIAGKPACATSFFQSLVNAFLQCLLVVAAGGAIKDLDTLLTPLISGAAGSLDSGNTGGAVNAVGKAAMSVVSSVAGGVVGGIAGSIKAKNDAEKEGQDRADKDLEHNSDLRQERNGGTNSPNGGGDGTPPVSAPTDGGDDDGDTGVETPTNPNGDNGDSDTGVETPTNPNGDDGNDGGDGGNDGGNDDGNGGNDGGNDDGSDDANGPEGNDGNGGPGGGAGGNGGDGEDGETQNPSEGKKNRLDVDNIKAGIGNAVQGVKNKIGDVKRGVKGIGRKFAKSKVGQFFNKNLIGRAISAPGRIGMRLAGKALKFGPHAILSGLKRGVGAGLKSAGAAIATAVVGKDAVGAFLGAKKGANDKEVNNTARKERIANAAREDRILSNVEEKTENYNDAVGELNTASQAEGAAGQELTEAGEELGHAETHANNKVEAMLQQDKQVVKAQQENQKVFDKYGVKNSAELNDKVSEMRKSAKTAEEKAELQEIEGAAMRVGLRESAIQRKKTAIAKVVAGTDGKNNFFAAGGVLHDVAGQSHAQVSKSIDDKMAQTESAIAEKQAMVGDMSVPKAQREAAQKELTQLEETKAQLEEAKTYMSGMDAGQKKVFDDEETTSIRTKTAAATERVAKAQTAYGKAHAKTTQAQEKVVQAAKEHTRAVSLATKAIPTFSGKGAKAAQGRIASRITRKGTIDDNIPTNSIDVANNEFTRDQSVATFLDETNMKPGRNSQYNVAELEAMLERYIPTPPAGHKLTREERTKQKEKAAISKKIQEYKGKLGTTATPTSYLSGLRTKMDAAETELSDAQSRLNFSVNDLQESVLPNLTGLPSTGKLEPSVVRTAFNTYKAGSHGKTSKEIQQMESLVASYEKSYSSYQTASTNHRIVQNEYNTHQAAMSHVNSMQTVAQTRADVMQGNVTRMNQLNAQANDLGSLVTSAETIIRTGKGDMPALTPEMMKLLNKYGGNITESSTPQQIKVAAERAEAGTIKEIGGLSDRNSQISKEIDELRAAIREVVSEITGEKITTHTPDASVPSSTFSPAREEEHDNGPTSVVNNINDSSTSSFNISGVGDNNGNASGYNHSDYDRMQNEYIRQNQDMLKRVKAQNDEIRDIIEDIESELNEE